MSIPQNSIPGLRIPFRPIFGVSLVPRLRAQNTTRLRMYKLSVNSN